MPYLYPKFMAKQKSQVDVLLPQLMNWTLDELRDLQGALGGLIEALEDEATVENERPSRKKKVGSIELKMIKQNGKLYGPYKYLRYWEGKKLKSKYLGKDTNPGQESIE